MSDQRGVTQLIPPILPRSTPTIAVTAGDPCGIGPEVILKALRTVSSSTPPSAGWGSTLRWVVIGDLGVFEAATQRLRHCLPSWRVIRSIKELSDGRAVSALLFLDCGHRSRFLPGRSSRAAGRASLVYLEQALTLQRLGMLHGLVTAPLTKWAVVRSAPSFIGHTEYLAKHLRVPDVLMMFVSDALRVALLTRHVALRQAAGLLTPRLIERSGRLLHEALSRQFRITHPRIALCGVNPHAGEGGRFGVEERRIMQPALRALARRGIACEGPWAADSVFIESARHRYDAIVCSYHDQGLIPFKMVSRDEGCQMTVGLPFVRTSPDHGSALDIAGRGVADPGSMAYALRLAMTLVTASRHRPKRDVDRR